MPRDIPVGNGNILVAFDGNYRLREFHFPHVGEENHIGERPFRFGVWVNGNFSWIPDGWRITKNYLEKTLITNVELTHDTWKLRIIANDLVDFHENIYLKKLTVQNFSGEKKEVRLFLAQNFSILGNDIGDTAAFRPEENVLLHYKANRYFLINTFANKKPGIDFFATGNKDSKYDTGTWKDAEDGVLSRNPIAQGSVDSVAAIHLFVEKNASDTGYYWICAGTNWSEVEHLNSVVRKTGPEAIIKRTADYWKLWVEKEKLNYDLLPEATAHLYRKSLLICRTQINNCGSIIAANDSDAIHFNRDTYSYMWPRDAALVAYALDLAGYSEITRNFFNFCAGIMEKNGYFLHKYNPSGSPASSWHPWQKDDKVQLPIQEDETALVIWALWHHYRKFHDIEFIKPLYKPFIKNAADFMMNYRDADTALPLPSYDLWEERRGVLTFTAAAVFGGLTAAAHFAESFGETELAEEYRRGARQMREAMDTYLYLEREKRFCRMINFKEDGSSEIDRTLDASLYGIFAFGAYDPHDEKVKNTMRQVYETLWCRTHVGGLARYENDAYYRASENTAGNPWFITTLWLAQYYIATACQKDDLKKALGIMQWVEKHALSSGVLAEQIHPDTNIPLSVSPLTWSHATYIAVVHEYLSKLLEIEKCSACGRPKYQMNRE
ncbi:glycoside hydrolase family 15 protein [Nitrosomonas sp. Is37]|uniref:glycoside hydrolase family 15 protein n=1 Tax=Nitrosomonas sp. Is37 TaxID=3080535 RepID=UPI00294B393F|nr:glycoside hydrolase family 15 protein [Nitrosomonas sp. Is37]MDV6342951.1 glycoside hydrolase family 15 protein [Nitrosomonas sp. Is37]